MAFRSENLSIYTRGRHDGYRVPARKKFLGTDGYRPEKKFWVPMGTGKISTYADPWFTLKKVFFFANLAEHAVNTSNGELESGFGRSGLLSGFGFGGFSFSWHFLICKFRVQQALIHNHSWKMRNRPTQGLADVFSTYCEIVLETFVSNENFRVV